MARHRPSSQVNPANFHQIHRSRQRHIHEVFYRRSEWWFNSTISTQFGEHTHTHTHKHKHKHNNYQHRSARVASFPRPCFFPSVPFSTVSATSVICCMPYQQASLVRAVLYCTLYPLILLAFVKVDFTNALTIIDPPLPSFSSFPPTPPYTTYSVALAQTPWPSEGRVSICLSATERLFENRWL